MKERKRKRGRDREKENKIQKEKKRLKSGEIFEREGFTAISKEKWDFSSHGHNYGKTILAPVTIIDHKTF